MSFMGGIVDFDAERAARRAVTQQPRRPRPSRRKITAQTLQSDQQNAQGAHTLTAFLSKAFPPKEPLAAGLLNRRDLVALGARRRNGKTTFLIQLALDLAAGEPQFLGYDINAPRRSLLFLLEDDPLELQEKMRRQLNARDVGDRVAVYTREDFFHAGIPTDAGVAEFRQFIQDQAAQHRPDLIVLDNLAYLVDADYGDSTKIHHLGKFVYALARDFNTAVIIAAHPRKQSSNEDHSVHLEDGDGTPFFESIMGSSHFINSMGSLWGMERQEERCLFLGGRQRGDGYQQRAYLELDDRNCFQVVADATIQREHVLNTSARLAAWDHLPQVFGFNDGRKSTERDLKARRTYSEWIAQCVRLGVLRKNTEGKYEKVVK